MTIVHDYFFNRGVPESVITISSASEPAFILFIFNLNLIHIKF